MAAKKKTSSAKSKKTKKTTASKKTPKKSAKKSTKKSPAKKTSKAVKASKSKTTSKKTKSSAKKKTTSKVKSSQKKKTSTKAAKTKARSKKSTKKSKKTSTKSKRLNYSSIDKQILSALVNANNNALVMDEIEEKLHISEEEIEKSIKRLENKVPPKIRTSTVMYKSKWVKQLTKIDDYGLKATKTSKSTKMVWETMNDLPCFICPFSKKCNEGQETYNPKTCPYLTDWLVTSLKGEEYTGNPFHQEYDSKKSKSKAKTTE